MISGRCTVRSAALRGVTAIPVDVEVAVSRGMPGFSIVGMVDAAVQESRERVKAALRESGYSIPPNKILVNLAPSSLRKTGSGFDLAIAIGILVATGQVDAQIAKNALFVGELSLNGKVRSVSGLLAYALCARECGVDLVCTDSAEGLIPIEGLNEHGLHALRDLGTTGYRPVRTLDVAPPEDEPDYREISGNEVGKRAFQIAATGSHGLLMIGPPGSGKTMLARRLPSILPPLDEQEKLSVALIHSVAGENVGPILDGRRPFRSPHHSATSAGLVGGGNPVRPGEISLAHLGVAFLDELPEFRSSVLQQLRQPLEEGRVMISRADGLVSFPSRFMLVAASNPCPCGYYGDEQHECNCTATEIRKYQNRIGGPLIDRIDLHIDVKRVPPNEVISPSGGTTSKDLREGVMRGREFASWRSSRSECAQTTLRGLLRACALEPDDEALFSKIATNNNMSGRAIVKTLSVARTIADIAQHERVGRSELYEALSFRLREEIGR